MYPVIHLQEHPPVTPTTSPPFSQMISIEVQGSEISQFGPLYPLLQRQLQLPVFPMTCPPFWHGSVLAATEQGKAS